jgi:hypothetical protein
MKNINRRESPRIEIKLRCHVTSPALWARGNMTTENISRSGLLMLWRGNGAAAIPFPSIGQILTVEIELPTNHGFGQKCIHCQGTVIRVAADGENPKVALQVNYMDFRSFHDRIRAMESLQPVANSWMA